MVRSSPDSAAIGRLAAALRVSDRASPTVAMAAVRSWASRARLTPSLTSAATRL